MRYMLVARSPSGVEERELRRHALHHSEYRIYAVGRPDGGWGGAPGRMARRSRAGRTQPGTTRSCGEYFCPGRAAIRTRAEGQRALRARRPPGCSPIARGPARQRAAMLLEQHQIVPVDELGLVHVAEDRLDLA